MKFSIYKRIKSFQFAFKGLFFVIRTQHNAWIHLSASGAVIVLGYVLSLQIHEWIWLTVAIGLVWTAEIMNTAIEKLVDLVSPDFHPQAGLVKDIAAGAVLVASITALWIGILIFLPKFF